MNARWHFASCCETTVSQLAAQLGISPLFARCLVQRGCDSPQCAMEYLAPKLARLSDPFLLPDMDRAVERLLLAHTQREPFVIFGDYDVDGVTATALLTEFFRALGWECSYYLPHRLDEGYGLTRDAVENCLQKNPATLILAVDCGSTSVEVIDELRTRGVDVVVLDHHQVCSPAPAAAALVNPQLLAGESPLKSLCSAGLAFKLAHAILKRCRALGWKEAHQHDLKPYLDLVALGTIADIVPLQHENRIFVRTGLERLAQTHRVGLRALQSIAGAGRQIDCYTVAFQLAPRLNAAGRLETALAALDLILTENPDQAAVLAQSLDQQNRERQGIEQKIVDEVISAIRSKFNPASDFAIVEGNPGWHVGVVGIVASRVLREFHRPVLILGSDGSEEWRGSGRSIEGFDIAAGLRQCSDLLLKHGGHAMAAGVTMHASRVDDFRRRFNELARSSLHPDALRTVIKLDCEVSLSELTFETLTQFEQIQPTGNGNRCIQLAARGLRCAGGLRRMGAEKQHLRFNVTDGRTTHQAVWWNCDRSELPSSFDLAFAPELSEYNGSISIQLKVLDLQSA